MGNDKRKEFIGQLAAIVDEIATQKFLEQNREGKMEPNIGEKIEGYKQYISALGGGFLETVENYLEAIQIAETNEVLGDVKLKARIKDYSSSSINSDKKELDDVFGIEVVTATELEKEILMLFTHLMFDISKDKKYNKKNGYVAYHCTGDLSPQEGDLQTRIKEIVKGAKAKEYVYSINDPKYGDKKKTVNIFPNLSKYITNAKELSELARVLSDMVEYVKYPTTPTSKMPLIEFHFFTNEVEHEAIRGRASHSNYKKTNVGLIEQYFTEGKLIRGINAPWKFVRNNDKLELQDFYETLLENWPFLKDLIVRKRNSGEESKDKKTTTNFDILTAEQFPFLRKYLTDNYEYSDDKSTEKLEKWGLLKALITKYRIDKQEHRPDLISDINQIWRRGQINEETRIIGSRRFV